MAVNGARKPFSSWATTALMVLYSYCSMAGIQVVCWIYVQLGIDQLKRSTLKVEYHHVTPGNADDFLNIILDSITSQRLSYNLIASITPLK